MVVVFGGVADEISIKVSVDVSVEVSIEVSIEVSVEVFIDVSVKFPIDVSVELPIEASVEFPIDVSVRTSVEFPTEASIGATLETSVWNSFGIVVLGNSNTSKVTVIDKTRIANKPTPSITFDFFDNLPKISVWINYVSLNSLNIRTMGKN